MIADPTASGAPHAAAPTNVIATEIVIVGAGLAGSVAAAVLGKAGHDVVLVDARAGLPNEFRVEKIAGDQVAILERLGLLDAVARAGAPFGEVLNVRGQRVVDRTRGRMFGLVYPDLVGAMRSQIPASVRFLIGRVADIETGREGQAVTLADGTRIGARLVVLATGMGDLLRSRLGMERRVLREKQSMSFGFTVKPGPDARTDVSALTLYGERFGDGIDYLTLFPIKTGLRANLFVFRDHRDPWVHQLRADPVAALASAMPSLTRYLGDFTVVDRVQNWLMDIAVVDHVRQPGVVLIGDAFQTSCPAAGTGVSRVLTDVERLCRVHLPGWLMTPGMGADKIAAFYDDPVKTGMDAHALALADYRQGLTVGRGVEWNARRAAVYGRRKILNWIDHISPQLVSHIRARRAASR